MTLSIDEAFAALLAEPSPSKRAKDKKPTSSKKPSPPSKDTPVGPPPTGMVQGFRDLSASLHSSLPPLESWTLEGVLIPIHQWKCTTCKCSGQSLEHHTAYLLHSYNRRKDTKHLRPLHPGELQNYSHVKRIVQYTESTTDICHNCVPVNAVLLEGNEPKTLTHPITELLGTASNPFEPMITAQEKIVAAWKEVFNDAFDYIEDDKKYQGMYS